MKRVIFLATNDIVFDQRINRAAATLVCSGFDVLVVGRWLPHTPQWKPEGFRVVRLRIPLRRGKGFYALFNLQAFFYLLSKRFDVLHANDLDTLLASRMVCAIRRKPLLYDSHELFTEVPELVKRPKARKVWEWLEKRLIGGVSVGVTVSEGVAHELHKRHGIQFHVVRNLPLCKTKSQLNEIPENLPEPTKTIIYQGALNLGRGLERLIDAMAYLPNLRLLLVGAGDVEEQLRKRVQGLHLEQRVVFKGRVKPIDLHPITCSAVLGVSLEEDMGLNYRYALPNKLFDYIQAHIPVLVSELPEMKRLVTECGVGETITVAATAQELAQKIESMLGNPQRYAQWVANAKQSALQLCWENEKGKLLEAYAIAMSVRNGKTPN